MRIRCSILFFIIAGMMSPILAQQFLGNQGQSQDSEVLRRLCDKNAGPKGWQAVQESQEHTKSCFESEFKNWNTEAQNSISKSGKMSSAFELYCQKIPNLKSCIKRYTDSVKVCLELDEQKNLDMLYRIGSRFLQFVCDKAEDIEKLVGGVNHQQCIKTNERVMHKCADKIIVQFNSSSTHRQKHVVPGAGYVPSFSLNTDIEGCRYMQEFEECTIKVLQQCQDMTPANLLSSLYQSINNEIPCGNLPKSHASPVSVVNFLLMIVAMAMTL